MEKTIKFYETIVIINPILDQKNQASTLEDLKSLIKKSGKIFFEEALGLKQLAYPIKKHTQGFYHVFHFTSETSFIQTLELNYRRNENILRYLTVHLDKFALKYHKDKKNQEITKQKEKRELDDNLQQKETLRNQKVKENRMDTLQTKEKVENQNEKQDKHFTKQTKGKTKDNL